MGGGVLNDFRENIHPCTVHNVQHLNNVLGIVNNQNTLFAVAATCSWLCMLVRVNWFLFHKISEGFVPGTRILREHTTRKSD